MWLLQQAPETMQRWLRDTRIPIIASKEDGSILWCNASFENFLGYTLPELLDKSWVDLTADRSDAEHDVQLVQECMRGDREEYEYQKHYLHKDRTTKSARIHVLRYPEKGEFRFFLVTVIPLEGYDKLQLDMLMSMERQLCMLVDATASTSNAMETLATRKDSLLVLWDWTQANPAKATILLVILGVMIFGDKFIEALQFALSLRPGE